MKHIIQMIDKVSISRSHKQRFSLVCVLNVAFETTVHKHSTTISSSSLFKTTTMQQLAPWPALDGHWFHCVALSLSNDEIHACNTQKTKRSRIIRRRRPALSGDKNAIRPIKHHKDARRTSSDAAHKPVVVQWVVVSAAVLVA